MQAQPSPPARASTSSTGDHEHSSVALAVRQAYATYDSTLDDGAALDDGVCENVRLTLALWRGHDISLAGAAALMHPQDSKNALGTPFVATRLDPAASTSCVRLCAELSTRLQTQRALNTLSVPADEKSLRTELLRVDPTIFFQLGRPGPGFGGQHADHFVDEAAKEPYEWFALAKLPCVSSACVAQLGRASPRTKALLGPERLLVRRPTTNEVYDLLDEAMVREQARFAVPTFAPHFAFFAAIALIAQYDLATLDAQSFTRVWLFAPSYNLFDAWPDRSFHPLLNEIATRPPTAYQCAQAEVLAEQMATICRLFEQLTVAYQH